MAKSTTLGSQNYLTTTLSSLSSNQNIAIGYQAGYNTVIDTSIEIINYMDFAFKIIGIDMDFEKFKNMTEGERKSFLRDIKINKLLC